MKPAPPERVGNLTEAKVRFFFFLGGGGGLGVYRKCIGFGSGFLTETFRPKVLSSFVFCFEVVILGVSWETF